MSDGISRGAGPVDINTSMAVPRNTLSPGIKLGCSGTNHEITEPAATSSLGESFCVGTSSSAVNVSTASCRVLPTKSGNCASDGPCEMTRVNVLPSSNDSPVAGSVRITLPAGTSSLRSAVTTMVHLYGTTKLRTSPSFISAMTGTSCERLAKIRYEMPPAINNATTAPIATIRLCRLISLGFAI